MTLYYAGLNRHEEIYRSDVALGEAGSGSGCCRPRCSSATMSFQSAIPWPVALRQSQASASPTGNDSQQPTLPYNDFSANGNNPFNSVSQPKGALQCYTHSGTGYQPLWQSCWLIDFEISRWDNLASTVRHPESQRMFHWNPEMRR